MIMNEQTKVLLDEFLKLGPKEQNAFKSLISNVKPKKQGKGTYGTGSIRLISKAKGSYKAEYKRMAKTIYATTQAEANRQLKQWVNDVDTSQYTNRGKLTI